MASSEPEERREIYPEFATSRTTRSHLVHNLPARSFTSFHMDPFRLEAILFETLVITRNTMIGSLWEILLRKPPGVVQRVVKNLFFEECSKESDALIALCSGATKIFLPTCTSYGSSDFWRSRAQRFEKDELFHPVSLYQNVTHLAISDDLVHHRSFQLSLLPNLTHLAYGTELDDTTTHFTQRVFRKCQKLEALLLLVDDMEMVQDTMMALVTANLVSRRLFVSKLSNSLEDIWRYHIRGEDIWEKVKRTPCSSVVYWKQTNGTGAKF